MHLCHKYSGSKLRQIGSLFDVRESAITEGSRRFALKMIEDKQLKLMVEEVKGTLGI
jgi:hypothetical protein